MFDFLCIFMYLPFVVLHCTCSFLQKSVCCTWSVLPLVSCMNDLVTQKSVNLFYICIFTCVHNNVIKPTMERNRRKLYICYRRHNHMACHMTVTAWGMCVYMCEITEQCKYAQRSWGVNPLWTMTWGSCCSAHGFCEDYASLGIRSTCWLVRLKAFHFAGSTGCMSAIISVQWWNPEWIPATPGSSAVSLKVQMVRNLCCQSNVRPPSAGSCDGALQRTSAVGFCEDPYTPSVQQICPDRLSASVHSSGVPQKSLLRAQWAGEHLHSW